MKTPARLTEASRSNLDGAFTLIELLSVIAVVTVLSLLLAPALASTKNRSQRAMCANNLKELGLGAFVYAEHYDGSYPITQAGSNPRNVINGSYYTRWTFFNPNKPNFHLSKSWDNYGDDPDSGAQNTATGTFWRNFGMLYPEKLAGDGSMFYCPALTAKNSPLGAGTYQPLLTTTGPLTDANTPGSVRSSYIYNPWVINPTIGLSPNNQRLLQKTSDVKARKVFGLDFMDGSTWNLDGTINTDLINFAHNRERGWNVLFTDNSVVFERADFRSEQVYKLGGFSFNDFQYDIKGICNLARLIWER